MARQKNPTALFDVIHSAKKPPKASPSASIPTPKWWGKGRSLPKPAVEASSENVGKQKSWLAKAKQNIVTPVAAPVLTAPVDQQPAVEYSSPVVDEVVESVATDAPASNPAEPKTRFIDRFVNRPAKAEMVEQDPIAEPIPSEPTITEVKPIRRISRSTEDRDPMMKVDSAARDIRFRLSFAGAVAIGFIFVLLLAIAFIAGKQSSSSQTAMDDQPTPPKESTTAPASGFAMAIGPTALPAHSVNSAPVNPDVLTIPQHQNRPAVVIAPKPTPVAPVALKNDRVIGLLYVIVQSYMDRDQAQAACNYMNEAGVTCTVVQGPSHWAMPDYYSVISLKSFNKHDPELAEFEREVKTLGSKYTNRLSDQFQPQAYTWRADSDLSQQ
jgi:hypothetical protein